MNIHEGKGYTILKAIMNIHEGKGYTILKAIMNIHEGKGYTILKAIMNIHDGKGYTILKAMTFNSRESIQDIFLVLWSTVKPKTCLKRPLKRRPKIGFQVRLLLNEGQKYCRMLQGKHSAILSTFIKLPFVFKTFILSIFEWPLKTGFTV